MHCIGKLSLAQHRHSLTNDTKISVPRCAMPLVSFLPCMAALNLFRLGTLARPTRKALHKGRMTLISSSHCQPHKAPSSGLFITSLSNIPSLSFFLTWFQLCSCPQKINSRGLLSLPSFLQTHIFCSSVL